MPVSLPFLFFFFFGGKKEPVLLLEFVDLLELISLRTLG